MPSDGSGLVRLRILGPMSATGPGDEPINLGGLKQRSVLAMLVLGKGHQVGADRLVDALWPAEQPRNAPAALQAYVSHLRRALTPGSAARNRSDIVVSQGQGYALRLPDDAVDAWSFEHALNAAAALSEPRPRAALLRESLELWHGQALLDFIDEEWAHAEALRLTELQAIAQEQLIAARLALGEHDLAVPDVQALLDAEPLREERWRLLVLALYRSNRQADALAALRRARTMFADELGLDPSPALQSLEAQVLVQAEALAAPTMVSPPPAVVPEPRRPTEPAPGLPPAVDLVDRDEELARLQRCLDDALLGRSGLGLISGAAGIGKSSLLHQARTLGEASGMTVLHARGSLLEREYGFGVLRQMFDPVLADDAVRDDVLSGAAVTAAAVFDATAGPSIQPEGIFAVLHGGYWMTVNLAARAPVLIAVDDLQWCDTGSLRFLAYLARRLEGLPIAVIATLRTGEDHADEELVAELTTEESTVLVSPEPLSAEGVATLVAERLGEGADPVFLHACHRTTGGNPLLLRQLLRALEADHVRPVASNADTVRAIGSRAVSSLVLHRFLRMPEASRVVARAVAVLGDGSSLPDVAALAGLDEPATGAALAALARAEVLRDDQQIGFVHPLVDAAVYGEIPTGERELLHERAAEVLTAVRASPERVAAQLMHGPRRGNPDAVRVLRDVARREVGRGATDSAITYLNRALAEPPSDDVLPYVLLEIGRVETMANGPAAVEHLTRAYARLTDPIERAEAAVQLVRTLVFAADRGIASRVAREAVATLPTTMVDERQHLTALERIAGYMHDLDPADYRSGPPPRISGAGVGARALAATLAWETLIDGEDRARAIELAEFAVADGSLQSTDTGLLWVVAGNTLGLSGVDTSDFWRNALSDAYARGGLFAVLGIHLWHGYVQWQEGDLRESYQSFLNCTAQTELWGAPTVGRPYVDAWLARVLLDRGDVAAARTVIDVAVERGGIGEGLRLVLESEALVLLAERRPVEAQTALARSDALMRVVDNPAWLSHAQLRVPVLAALGRASEAVALAETELARARLWGTPALVGTHLRILAELRDDPETRLAELEEAVRELEGSSARLERARAVAALARHHAEQRDDTDATVLRLRRRALHLAYTCGADGMVAELSGLLALAGIEVGHTPSLTTSLTSSELKIARMAVDGIMHGEIAQTLFVTPRHVQNTVKAVCDRLGVDSMAALADALDSG